MTWRRIVFKNTLKTSGRYFGYLSSSSLAVLVYFMFASFTANPAVKSGYIPATAGGILTACQYVIVVFAIFFVLFFHSALLRLRSKEFGLFSVLGVTPAQIRSSVFMESVGFGAAALLIGGVLGALLTKLFLMAMASVMQLSQPIAFAIPRQAVINTLVIFGIVFLMDGIVSAIRVSRATAKHLLLGGRAKQKMPKFSPLLVIVGLLCIIASYLMAIYLSGQTIMIFLPTVALVTIGTYLLFSQVAVFFVQTIRRRSLTGTSMLIVGRLAHRLKDNARVLTVVTVLSAAVLSGMGAVVGFNSILVPNSLRTAPASAMLAEPAGGTNADISPASLDKMFETAHLSHLTQVTTPVLVASGQMKDPTGSRNMRYKAIVVSESQFNRLREGLAQNDLAIKDYLPKAQPIRTGHALFLVPYPLAFRGNIQGDATTVRYGGGHLAQVVVDQTSDTRVFNERSDDVLPDDVLVVSDADYKAWSKQAPESSKWAVHSWLTPDWAKMAHTADKFTTANSTAGRYVSFSVTAAQQSKQFLSVTIFAGFFVSLLFFIACGSAIYFRLQAQREEDTQQFYALQRLGMQRQELARVVTAELAILFFLPIVIAIVHSIFAMTDFSNLLHLYRMIGNVWLVFGGVAGLYVVCMIIYFVVARSHHTRVVIK